jgi:hypothetical protein
MAAVARLLGLLVGDFAPSFLGPFTGVLSDLWGWGSFTLSGRGGIEAYERSATGLIRAGTQRMLDWFWDTENRIDKANERTHQYGLERVQANS